MADGDPSVTVVTEYFHPEEASTAQLMTDLTTGLADRFDVTVVTRYPNHFVEDDADSRSSDGHLEGVTIDRLPATRFDKDTLPLRIVNWVTFTLLVSLQLLWSHRDDDLLMVGSNPPPLPLAAWVVRALTDTPFVYLVYDMYPDMPVALGYLSRDGVVRAVWDRAMRRLYADADRIVVLGESMRRRLIEKMDGKLEFDEDRVDVIPNWADGEFIQPLDKQDNEFACQRGITDQFTLLYSGNIGRFHELRTAIDAIGELERRGRTDVGMLVIGDGARKRELQDYVTEAGIDGVEFCPFQPKERLPVTLTAGDASLVGIKPQVEGMCVSSKLYTSLAAGMPVLAVVGSGDEVARVVESHDCGVHVEPGDPERVADVLESWADDPEKTRELGRNARECFESHYRLQDAVDAYVTLFESVIAETSPGS